MSVLWTKSGFRILSLPAIFHCLIEIRSAWKGNRQSNDTMNKRWIMMLNLFVVFSADFRRFLQIKK